jgi:cytochrome P450
VNLISNGVLAMLRHGYAETLRSDPALVPPFVEETLRHDPPVQMTARLLAEDAEICGVPMKEGSMVYLLLAAAHRDPREFTDPAVSPPGERTSATSRSGWAITTAWVPRWRAWRHASR